MDDTVTARSQSLVVRGVAWNSLYQVFATLLNFASMLVLVRVIPPVEYGRVGTVVGLLTVFNAFNCAVFMRQALQLPAGCEPDWSLHWSVGFYVQLASSAVCHALAGVCWFSPSYRSIAPLLHLGAIGLILDWPNRLGGIMLLRQMDFMRMRVLAMIAMGLNVAVSLSVALAGGGAYAIVLGSNVVATLPCAADLLLVRRWHPRRGWWRWPDWKAYRPALQFGLQQGGAALLSSTRGALEAAVLPGSLGYVAIGLLNRAQALFAMTVGRLGNVLIETVYPLLPRYASEPSHYRRHATTFVQVVFLLVVPGAIYVGREGPTLSRLVYGEKWIAADPLIWPGVVIGFGLTLFTMGWSILLAVNRLRMSFALDVVAAMLGAPMVMLAWAGCGLLVYAWAIAVAQLVAGVVALRLAAPLLEPSWWRRTLLPPAAASLVGLGGALAVGRLSARAPLFVGFALTTAAYTAAVGLSLRWFFPEELEGVLSRVPGGMRLNGWLGLRARPLPTV